MIVIGYTRPSEVNQQNPHEHDRLLRYLDREERVRWESLSNELLRHRYLISHSLIRTTLTHYAQQHLNLVIDPQSIQLAKQPKGKPIIAAPAALQSVSFSLTHTHDLAAVAVSASGPVGLDAEWLHRQGPSIAVAKRFFTLQEYEDIRSAPQAQQHQRLLTYWTLKEAYVKAVGTGISSSFKKFRLILNGSEAPRLEYTENTLSSDESWHFHSFTLANEYLVALACHTCEVPHIINLRP
ncbi:4'-phosphopantetheinyl transferase family protein [Orrella sp. 11846]|uniref:4'-phosphopantetheinyl transferase family protein n=1 Tax=Orrella sp. 11846 TaxID=3409913 RepID=UPI003B5C5662